jgi:hypothetical protein
MRVDARTSPAVRRGTVARPLLHFFPISLRHRSVVVPISILLLYLGEYHNDMYVYII